MSHGASALAAFHLIGDRSGLDSAQITPPGLRPALFGSYSDLSGLRYDYPLVLTDQTDDGTWVRSLADIIDGTLQRVAEPGVTGEATRRQLLSLEQTIRTSLADGHKGSLLAIWEAASRHLITTAGNAGESMEIALQQARETIGFNGEIVDCDVKLATKMLTRAWQESERPKAENLRNRVEQLAQKLTDILKVDYMHSPEACAASHLESSMGSTNQSVFDFQSMARVLRSVPTAEALPENRKQRIQAAISTLTSQHFVSPTGGLAEDAGKTYRFGFDDCSLALSKYRERLPEMAKLVKAISIAQLEIENRYDESHHQDFFDSFDENCLGPADLEQFPSYLLCLENVNETDKTAILEILRAGLPFKMMAQTNDILEDDSIAKERLSFGTRGQQLARMAMGLEQVFVLQAASSSLYRMRESILQGLSNGYPALFSVYSGADEASSSSVERNSLRDGDALPAYLVAAAATESRAFPCFTHNPAAGREQISRFHLTGNPDPTQEWPEHTLSFEDAEHKSQTDKLLFTLVDFIAADSRYARRFVCVPVADWVDEMTPAGEYLQLNGKQRASRVPYLLLIDTENNLHRAVIDERLIEAAERCGNAWHSLQELAGINNSHASAALALAQQAWDEEKDQLTAAPATESTGSLQATDPESAPASPTVAATEELAVPVEEDHVPSGNEPWIESIRCTTCNECTQLNDRLFAYDADKRAYIADPEAGTYRELVEAAESCQVAIIHPGMPRNPDEPGLEELMERALPFN